MDIPVEVSAHHVHLTAQDIATLFGAGHALTHFKEVSQPGQFASKETVVLRGPKGEISGVRIVGPARERTQVELSLTNCRTMGVDPVFRVSGELDGAGGGVAIVGPNGEVEVQEGVIVALRHLHIEPAKAAELGVRHLDRITVRIGGERGVTLHHVVVRSREGFDALALHLDTDEGNAAGVRGPVTARFIEME
jgi:putative phosphotransacetylase